MIDVCTHAFAVLMSFVVGNVATKRREEMDETTGAAATPATI